MPAGVLPLSERLRSGFRFLRSLAVAQAAIGILVLPFALTLAPLQTALVVVGILAYAFAKVHRFRTADGALKQMRFEERFFRQHLDEQTLRDCLARSEHLWDDSHTLRGLRGVQTVALPMLLSREERIRLIQRKFHAAFLKLVPSRIEPEVTIPAAAFGYLLFAEQLGGSLWTTMFLIAVLAALLMEAAKFGLASRVRRQLASFERALSVWALAQEHLFRKEPSAPRPYRHHLYYRSEPVFSIRRAIHLRRAQF
jgi:hypothetical protein